MAFARIAWMWSHLASAAVDPGDVEVVRRGAIELRWAAPTSGCPTADAVIDEAMASTGGAPSDRALVAIGTVAESAGGLTLTLVVQTEAGEGTRTVEATDCRQLARVASLVIALAIDPSAIAPTSPVEPAPVDPPPPEPVIELPPPVAPSEDRPPPLATPVRTTTPRIDAPAVRPRRVHGSALLSVGVGAFALPGPTAAIELAIAIATSHARAELGGLYWAPGETRSRRNQSIGGDFQLAGVAARGCWVPTFPRASLELPLCGVLEVAAMIGRGTGDLAVARDAAAPWIAMGGGPTLLWRPEGRRIGLLLRVEGMGALTQPAFETRPSGVVWRTRPAALQATGGVEIRFAGRP